MFYGSITKSYDLGKPRSTKLAETKRLYRGTALEGALGYAPDLAVRARCLQQPAIGPRKAQWK